MTITLSEAAAAELKQVIENQKLEEETVLRMGIAGGGCAGVQYELGLATDFDPSVDARYEQHGVPVVARKKMALFLDGTSIDFQKTPYGNSGFAIENPNLPQGGMCPGCGSGGP